MLHVPLLELEHAPNIAICDAVTDSPTLVSALRLVRLILGTEAFLGFISKTYTNIINMIIVCFSPYIKESWFLTGNCVDHI